MKTMICAAAGGLLLLALAGCGQDEATPVTTTPSVAESPEKPTAKASAPAAAEKPTPPRSRALAAGELPRRGRQNAWLESLSDVQRTSINDLRQRAASRLGTVRRQQREQQKDFHEALVAGDRSGALAASGRLADLAAEAERARLEEMIELSGLLTPEQREQMPQQMRGGMRAGRPGAGRRAAAGATDED